MNIVLSICSTMNKIFTWGVIVNKIDPVNQFSPVWNESLPIMQALTNITASSNITASYFSSSEAGRCYTTYYSKSILIKEECANVNKYEKIFYLKTSYCCLFYHLTTTILVSFWHKLVSSRNVSFLVVIHMIHHTWWLDIPLNCYIYKFNIWTKFSLHQGPWQVWIFTNAALSACYNFKKWSSRVGMYMYLWSLLSWSF